MAKKFNELFSSARDGADNVKQIIKVKHTISKCEDELAALLYELGCEVYEGKLSDNTDEDAIALLFDRIGALRSNIKKLTAEFNALNGKVECESCGKLTSSDFDFCPFCGAKLFDTVINEEEEEEEADETDEAGDEGDDSEENCEGGCEECDKKSGDCTGDNCPF